MKPLFEKLLRPIRKQRIHLYTNSWNEEEMLGFFFRHYDPIVDRYVIYDDGSTDSTLPTLRSHPKVEVRRFERVAPDSYVRSARILHNGMWKESRGEADWVIVTDIDEHLTHPNLRGYLRACRRQGVTAIPALGYDMAAETFPSREARLAEVVTVGVPSKWMQKLSIFDPSAIEETHFAVGRHQADPTGRVRYPETDELLLLHYKYIDPDYVARRHALLGARLGRFDRTQRWGFQYELPQDRQRQAVEDLLKEAIDIADPSYRASEMHPLERWWRSAGSGQD